MNPGQLQPNQEGSDEIVIGDLVAKLKKAIIYIKSKWVTVLVFCFVGSSIGIIYSITKKPIYTATCTFVLEEGGSKGGALSQYAGLASLAGIDIGGGGGIFQGDNIIELYKSRTMIEKTLLCSIIINGKKTRLIERYADFNHLWERWNKGYTSKVNFNENLGTFDRRQDSIITDIAKVFNKKVLSVSKPDKKLSIINVSLSSNDELFAKVFTDSLVQNVNNFYVQTKTKKTLQSVEILQLQRDSVRRILNSALSGVASSLDATPNPNPALLSLRVSSQKKQIDVQTSTAIYAEIVKNLELSKMSLRQETPLIQVIDAPLWPLEKKQVSKLIGAVVGAFIGLALSILSLLVKLVF